jgi:hypothetical protein
VGTAELVGALCGAKHEGVAEEVVQLKLKGVQLIPRKSVSSSSAALGKGGGAGGAERGKGGGKGGGEYQQHQQHQQHQQRGNRMPYSTLYERRVAAQGQGKQWWWWWWSWCE